MIDDAFLSPVTALADADVEVCEDTDRDPRSLLSEAAQVEEVVEALAEYLEEMRRKSVLGRR